MPRRHLELEEAKSLLDVVFGVVIALALIELPAHGWILLSRPTHTAALPVLLLTSGLIFSAFYWVETRFFLEHQKRFDAAVSKDRGSRTDGVRLPLAIFLLGTLAMMTAASGILTSAAEGHYIGFLGASLTYWFLDVGGTVALRRTYRSYWATIAEKAPTHTEAFHWFLLHIRSRFFLLYGGANVLFIFVLLLIDLRISSADVCRTAGALSILAITMLRHLWLRSACADWWLKRQLRRTSVD